MNPHQHNSLFPPGLTEGSNWTAENTPANLGVTTSWAEFKIENISIDTASTTNVAAFIWADGLSGTVTDFLHLADVQLERGPVATNFEYRDFTTELLKCQRYTWEAAEGTSDVVASGFNNAANTAGQFVLALPVEMCTDPSLTVSAVGHFSVNSNATTDVCSALSLQDISTKRAGITTTHGAVGAAGDGSRLLSTNAYASMLFESEL